MRRLKNEIVFYGLIMLYFALAALSYFDWIEFRPLKGFLEKSRCPELTIEGFLTGSYQVALENYTLESSNLRPIFVRLNNQLDFTLFGELHARDVLEGQDLYLFQQDYVDGYTGKDFLGQDSIASSVSHLHEVYQSLRSSGKELLVVIVPDKSHFYREYLPGATEIGDFLNHQVFREELEASQIPLIDLNDWFLQLKDSSIYPLFPRYGIHWSEYGSTLALDTLLRKIESLTSRDLPDFTIQNVQLSDQIEGTDYDLGDALNLFFKLPQSPMAYARYSWSRDSSKYRPKTLVISDSFYWNLHKKGLHEKAFKPTGFWYYNQLAIPGYIPVDSLDFKSIISETELVIVLGTASNFRLFPYGFEERYIEKFGNF